MNISQLQGTIDTAWEKRAEINSATGGDTRQAVTAVLDALDRGELRVAEKRDGKWETNQWLKKAVLLSFRLNDSQAIPGGGDYASLGTGKAAWFDKVPSKFAGWGKAEFDDAGFRAVPNCVVRRSAYIAPGVVLMPSFVNVGAYVDSGTMVDTWATVGSCAQIGKNCHISGGAGIGGVLEPLQAGPVVIEDNCFIGARAEVAVGVIVEEGSVLSMGVYLGASTKIVDRATGEVYYGRVPAYSVVVSGTMPGKPLPNGEPGPSLYCAVIVKRVDEKTRSKTSINDLLRDSDQRIKA
ncbi:MAG: 2,3,4,5-tetrahydropyridine-2,6-dicarboxylate N-succinyltransferase [Rhodospirillaceae bacterium]|nr:MAG: 2,3,4,5-tetrahydropyridine-2,6-dicarboxylate N-succinyltransferase [Rhodospirillaceae bacterium]